LRKVTVTGALNATAGADNAGSTQFGGDVEFHVDELIASRINLAKSGTRASSGDVIFEANSLNLTDDSTEINFEGTDTATYSGAGVQTGGVSFDTIDIANSNRLKVANNRKAGGISLGTVNVEGRSAEIAIEDPSKAVIGNLMADGSNLTLVVPEEIVPYGAGNNTRSILIAQYATVDHANILLAGHIGQLVSENVNIIAADTLDGEIASIEFDYDTIGYMYEYLFHAEKVGDNYILTVDGYRASPVMKSLSEGHVASQAFLNTGSDLVAGEGVPAAVFAAADPGFSLFSSFSYGSSRYETGSHIDVSGLSLLIGGAYGIDASVGRFTIGAFLEYGNGAYDTYNDFTNYRSIHGSGDTDYVGGGALARLDFARSDSGYNYAEASARAGRLSVDFESGDLDSSYSYDTGSTYYGFHLGLGRVFDITDSTAFDLYGKWIFTHQGANDVTVRGEGVHFGDVSSHRLRGGFKVSTEINERVKPFFGAAYDHELDGKAKASVGGMPVEVPELKGGTGVGELGMSITATESATFDLGVQGYVGARRGVSGSLGFNYNF
jgi:hypothetical protein